MTVPIDLVLSKLQGVKREGAGFEARCPAHEDQTPSLSVTEGDDGRVLLCCHAGCSTEAILLAAGLEMRDLFPPRQTGPLGQIVATYDYHNANGAMVCQSVRYPPQPNGKKTFRQRRPDGAGGWIWKHLEDCPLYHLPKLRGREAVFVVEGEKDADRLCALGLPATTNIAGAGKWRPSYARQLQDAGVKRVCVLPDNDEPGEAHGRDVARSCDDAGLFVKLIPLPGLPVKGDVSDWLDSGRTKVELLDIVRNAPPFRANGHLVSHKPALELTTLADLLNEPDDAIDWLVEDRIPGGSLCILAGKPKAGKSTLARALAFAVASGERWLGWRVVQGPVWYLALEDKRSEVRRHFRKMGATGKEPIWVLVGEAPSEVIALLEARAATEKPALIIVDTLQRLIRASDMNDYAEVTTKFAPLLKLSRETGAAVVVLHHAKKFGEGSDSILGSTALAGSVDNVFILGRGDRDRTLSSDQRIGDCLDQTVVSLDPDTGHVRLDGSKKDADVRHARDAILEYLGSCDCPQTEREIREHVESRPQDQAQALRVLWRQDKLVRTGAGKRGDPWRYTLPSKAGSEVEKGPPDSFSEGVSGFCGSRTTKQQLSTTCEDSFSGSGLIGNQKNQKQVSPLRNPASTVLPFVVPEVSTSEPNSNVGTGIEATFTELKTGSRAFAASGFTQEPDDDD